MQPSSSEGGADELTIQSNPISSVVGASPQFPLEIRSEDPRGDSRGRSSSTGSTRRMVSALR